MCDYSLHDVASRPAKTGDKLTSTRFPTTITRGFADPTEPNVAVCLLPGTELAFESEVRCDVPHSCRTGNQSTRLRDSGRSISVVRPRITTRWNSLMGRLYW